MSGIQFSSPVINQKASPAVYASSLATRPAPQLPGRIFVDTDNPSTGMYRDTGTAWIQIASTSSPEADTLQTVTDRGNTTTNEVTLGSATAPTATLDIYGGGDTPDIVAKIQGTSTNSAFIQFTQNGTAQFFTGNRYKGGANLYIIGNSQTPQDTVLINSSTNRIAIGGHTDTPAYLLSIGGTLQNTTSAYFSTDSGNVGIGNTTASYKLDVTGTLRSTQGANFATTSGNVGILTTSPTNLLTLVGSTTGRGIDFVSQANFALVTGKINYETTNDLFSIINASSWGNSALIFGTNNTERARFTLSGRLLIGTSTESTYILDANGTVRVQGTELRLDNATTGVINLYSATPVIQFAAGTGDGYSIGRTSTSMNLKSNGAILMYIGANQSYQFDATNGHLFRSGIAGSAVTARLTTGGNFMVGTTTDSGNRVRINGSLRIDGQTSGSSGGSSGQHLIIDCDGTTYKIALLNP